MRQVPPATLLAIHQHFHAVIRGRTAELADLQDLVLPELGPLLTAEKPEGWFPVAGMLGGFRYWLEGDGEQAKLVTESWCRAVEGSGQRHEITARGSVLLADGFC